MFPKYSKKLEGNNKKNNVSDSAPVWFDKTITKEEMTEEELNDLNSMLEKYNR